MKKLLACFYVVQQTQLMPDVLNPVKHCCSFFKHYMTNPMPWKYGDHLKYLKIRDEENLQMVLFSLLSLAQRHLFKQLLINLFVFVLHETKTYNLIVFQF